MKKLLSLAGIEDARLTADSYIEREKQFSDLHDILVITIALKENIETHGFTKQIAEYVQTIGGDTFFTDATVSLQGFLDGTDDQHEVSEIAMNGISSAIASAIKKIKGIIKKAVDKLKALFKEVDGATLDLNEFLKNNAVLLTDKVDWDSIKDKRIPGPRIIKLKPLMKSLTSFSKWDILELTNLLDISRITTLQDIPNTASISKDMYIVCTDDLRDIKNMQNIEKDLLKMPNITTLKVKDNIKELYDTVVVLLKHVSKLFESRDELFAALNSFIVDLQNLPDAEFNKRIQHSSISEAWFISTIFEVMLESKNVFLRASYKVFDTVHEGI